MAYFLKNLFGVCQTLCTEKGLSSCGSEKASCVCWWNRPLDMVHMQLDQIGLFLISKLQMERIALSFD